MPLPSLQDRIMAGTMFRYQKLEIITGLRKVIRQDKKRLASRQRKLRRLQNSLAPDPFGKNPERLIFCLPDDKRESKVIKILAARLRESRELCGYGLRQAAQLLSIAPEDLRKIEGATGVDSVPMWLVGCAAEVYNVPSDFLFAIVDNFDADDSEAFRGRNLIAGLQRLELENFTKTATEQIRQNSRFKAVNTAVVELVMRVQSLSEVVNRFMQINPTFQDMAGSAPVLRQTKLAENAGLLATNELTRYKALPESLANHTEQMNEFFPSHNSSFSD